MLSFLFSSLPKLANWLLNSNWFLSFFTSLLITSEKGRSGPNILFYRLWDLLVVSLFDMLDFVLLTSMFFVFATSLRISCKLSPVFRKASSKPIWFLIAVSCNSSIGVLSTEAFCLNLFSIISRVSSFRLDLLSMFLIRVR